MYISPLVKAGRFFVYLRKTLTPMAKHSKYEPVEREMILEHLEKIDAALNDGPAWPKKTPYSDVGDKWFSLVMSMKRDIYEFQEEWNIPPMEDDDD
jgi:hypothetical protein